MRTSLRLGCLLLRIVRRIHVGHAKGTHRAHGNDGGTLGGREVMGVRRYGPRVANLHRLGLQCIEGITHADEYGPLLDGDRLIGGMAVRLDLVPRAPSTLPGERRPS